MVESVLPSSRFALVQELRQSMGLVKDSLKSAVKEIDQQLISISENQILLRNEPFKASMVSYFDS